MSAADNQLAHRIAARGSVPGVLALHAVERLHAELSAPSRFQTLSGRLLARAAAPVALQDAAFVWHRAPGAPEALLGDLQPAQPVALGIPLPWRHEALDAPLPASRTLEPAVPSDDDADAMPVALEPAPDTAASPLVQRLLAKRTGSPGLAATRSTAALRADPQRTTLSGVGDLSAGMIARYTGPSSADETAAHATASAAPYTTASEASRTMASHASPAAASATPHTTASEASRTMASHASPAAARSTA